MSHQQTPTRDERLEAIRERADKATAGPWVSDPLDIGLVGDVSTPDGNVARCGGDLRAYEQHSVSSGGKGQNRTVRVEALTLEAQR